MFNESLKWQLEVKRILCQKILEMTSIDAILVERGLFFFSYRTLSYGAVTYLYSHQIHVNNLRRRIMNVSG